MTAYLAQDYIVAESLDIAVREHGSVRPADALRLATQLAGALDFAAAVRVDHGILHPRDVLLSADETRLTGLGVARALERVGVPTPVRRPYTAPERVVGSEWDRRADVFGLAALVYELLWARRLAAVGQEAADALTAIAGGDLARIRAVFGRALAEDPGHRFDTALEFAAALEDALPEITIASRQPVVRGPQPVVRGPQPVVRGPQSVVRGPRSAVGRAVRGVRLQPDRNQRSVRLQPDRDQTEPNPQVHLKADTTCEPRLPLEAPDSEQEPADSVASGDRNLRRAESGRYADVESAPALADSAVPVVVPSRLMDSHQPRGSSTFAAERPRSRSSISPVALALVIGAALGFAAGYGVGARDRSAGPVQTAATVVDATTPPVTPGPGREFTESAVKPASDVIGRSVRLQPDLAPKPDAGVEVRLKPDTTTTSGSLLVRSAPLGASVFVDGRDYGRTPVTVRDLARGRHRVRVIRDGYTAEERQVTMTSSQRARSMTVRLSPARTLATATVRQALPRPSIPATIEPHMAPLAVESRPDGAKVFIDGRLVGTTPLALTGVTTGEHTLLLERDGYHHWSSSVRVVGGEPKRVTASLER